MDNFYAYLQAFFPHMWALLVGGAFFGVDKAAKYWCPPMSAQLDAISPSNRNRLAIAAIIIAVFWAGYAAWSDDHSKLLAAQTIDNRPISRHISGGVPYRIDTGRDISIYVGKSDKKMTDIYLPPTPEIEQKVYISNAEGDGPMVVHGNGFNVFGDKSYSMPFQPQSETFRFNGSEWVP